MFRKIAIARRSFLREMEKGNAYACKWFAVRFYFRYLHNRLDRSKGRCSCEPLTIVVPAVEKDAQPLTHCLKAANQMMRHPLAAKLVIGPESAAIREIAAKAGWEFVLEDRFLPRPSTELKCRGWVLQQFIKFNAAFHVPTGNYLVLDADTVFLKPQTFFRSGKSILRYSDQYELLYNRSLELVFGNRRRFPVSFVTHHMVFNRDQVAGLLKVIEQRFKKRWWEAMLHEIDKGNLISFSEFEFYGNYIVSRPNWKRHYILEYWNGLDKSAGDLQGLLGGKNDRTSRINSISFHCHTQ